MEGKARMIAKGFKSVIWVATVGTAALGCYMVSLKVATERADLARVEAHIISAKQDIRSLQTELGTRGRLSQLEQWNADVLALSAPSSAQFLQSEVTLARFEQTAPTLDQRSAEVRMAAAQAPAPPQAAPALPVVVAAAPAPAPAAPAAAIHRASFTPAKPEPKAAAAKVPAAVAAAETKKSPEKADTAKPAPMKMAAKVEQKTPPKAEAKKPAAKPETKAAPSKARASRLDAGLTAQIKSGAGQADGGN
jgi:hypothetical protein